MRKWLHDNPWIWIALFLGSVVTASMVVVVIAEINKPEIVKVKPHGHTPSTSMESGLQFP